MNYRRIKYILASCLAATVYLGCGRLGHLLASITGNASPVWPAAGFAVALFAIYGRRFLPALALGIVASNLMVGRGLWNDLGISLANVLAYYAGGFLLSRLMRPKLNLEHHAFSFGMVAAGLAAATLSAVGGIVFLWMGRIVPADQLHTVLWTWWVGDGIGCLVVTPLIFSIFGQRERVHWKKLPIFLSLSAVTAAMSYYFFYVDPGQLLFLVMYPLLMVGFSYLGSGSTAWATFLISALSVTITAFGYGPFGHGILNNRLLETQIFLGSIGVTGLIFGDFKDLGERRLADLIFAVGLVMCGVTMVTLQKVIAVKDQNHFEKLVNEAENAIYNRFLAYEDALRGGVGLFRASREVTHDEWHQYVASLNIFNRYPGIAGMGFIEAVRAADLNAMVHRIRRSGIPDFTVRIAAASPERKSENPDSEHFIVSFLESTEETKSATGLDVSGEPIHRTAIERARDLGITTMTDPLLLTPMMADRQGFLMFLPVYRSDLPTDTVEHRRKALLGLVYAPFVVDNFFRGVLGKGSSEIAVEVRTTTANEKDLRLYASEKGLRYTKFDGDELSSSLHFGTKKMNLIWHRTPDFTPTDSINIAWMLLIGVLISLLFATLIANLKSMKARAEKLVQVRTLALREHEALLARQNKDLEMALDQAEEGTRAKSAFIANMSHEFRTPMNAILGMGQLLKETHLDHEQKQLLKTVLGAGENLMALIEDILDFSKIEAGQMRMEQVPFDLDELVDQTMRVLAVKGHEKKLNLNVIIAPKTPSYLLGDPTRLRQVIFNLFGNGIKFTELGNVSLTISRNQSHLPGNLMFTVQDTGIGIPANKMSSLFNRFTQVDESMTRKYGGTGLGLSICKSLVELMGGGIEIESHENKGTKIVFTISCAVISQPSQFEILFEKAAGTLFEKRLLVASPYPEVLTQLAQMVQQWGCEAVTCFDQRSILKEVGEAQQNHRPFHAILLDVAFSGGSRLYIAHELAEVMGTPRKVMVMIPSHFRSEHIANLKENGFFNYLIKPVPRSELLETLKGVFLSPLGEQRSRDLGKENALPLQNLDQVIDIKEGARILLADDNEDNRQLVHRFLKGLPLVVVDVENGREAVEFVKSKNVFDLILMDIQMPILDGHSATREIRAWENEQGRTAIPIVALTAYVLNEDKKKALDAGCTAYLPKPLKKKELLDTLRTYLPKSSEIKPESMGGPITAQVDEDLRDLIPEYLRSRHRDIIGIEQALQTKDLGVVRLIGHKLRGTADAYGFSGLTPIGQALEAAAQNGDWLAVTQQLSAYRRYMDVVVIVYRKVV